ncbi:hypothetical protein GJ496_002068 [Pomphorhynchus laevis]|nr:hypothetical protein GJ496_002068 [Pomphorhynchus laevis]
MLSETTDYRSSADDITSTDYTIRPTDNPSPDKIDIHEFIDKFRYQCVKSIVNSIEINTSHRTIIFQCKSSEDTRLRCWQDSLNKLFNSSNNCLLTEHPVKIESNITIIYLIPEFKSSAIENSSIIVLIKPLNTSTKINSSSATTSLSIQHAISTLDCFSLDRRLDLGEGCLLKGWRGGCRSTVFGLAYNGRTNDSIKILYNYARICSILRKSNQYNTGNVTSHGQILNPNDWQYNSKDFILVRDISKRLATVRVIQSKLCTYQKSGQKSIQIRCIHQIYGLLYYVLVIKFSKYYSNVKILTNKPSYNSDSIIKQRIQLLLSIKQLCDGLFDMLNVTVVDEM